MCPDFPEEDLDALRESLSEKSSRPARSGDSSYVNLHDALPTNLFRAVERFVHGPLMVYIPAAHTAREQRRAEILETYRETRSIRRTAKLLRCSRTTVRQLVRQECESAS
ncbi:MAG: helix-turn-helix domain-containing protein [Candidatus Lernaella stagnicola]|nr:helix-turn-helix domain-containing protein [Candidatus Lernaella stagnicola]